MPFDQQQEMEIEMMYLFGLEDAQGVQRERVRRAEQRRVMTGLEVIDSFVRRPPEDADIIEIAFGRACEGDRIGA